MLWCECYGPDAEPSVDQIAEYIGESGSLFLSLLDRMDRGYRTKPKPSYSGCSMKPGWNLKFKKGGQSLATVYPESGGFSAFVLIPYRLENGVSAVLDRLSPVGRRKWEAAQDYMKMGKWMMLDVRDAAELDDLTLFLAVKLPPME